jgi:predicted NBD/HSP70 family sugar kinase
VIIVSYSDFFGFSPAIIPPLDRSFLPAAGFNRHFRSRVQVSSHLPLKLALERSDGVIATFSTQVFAPGTPEFPLNHFYVERLAKFLLWQQGGWKLTVGGPVEIGEHLRTTYSPGGARAFDYEFMSRVYERPFTVVITDSELVPDARENPIPLGRHLDGCRVGFDLGASDRKSSAVIDGRVVFSEEVPWDPRNASNPEYHYQGVLDSIRRAAGHLPRLDAVGGSSAGVYVANRARVASLFRGVPPKEFEQHIAGMFLRIREELGVPIEIINDGEVTALAGSMSLGDNPVLGIALGSSQAAGYVNAQGHITGGLNELAFAPIDYRPDAPADEWSGDIGCGVQYFSQVGAIRVATAAGMNFDEHLGLPERLVVLQQRMQQGDPLAQQVYETLGTYLGYGLAHYSDFYVLKHVLILGRVTSGAGGEILLEKSREVMRSEFPDISARLFVSLPDESNRRVGQSIAAASLPSL